MSIFGVRVLAKYYEHTFYVNTVNKYCVCFNNNEQRLVLTLELYNKQLRNIIPLKNREPVKDSQVNNKQKEDFTKMLCLEQSNFLYNSILII